MENRLGGVLAQRDTMMSPMWTLPLAWMEPWTMFLWSGCGGMVGGVKVRLVKILEFNLE
jgi:hypothetical protein